MKHLIAPRLWLLVILPPIAFSLVSLLTADQALILILNVVLTSVSCAATIAFTPEVFRIVYNDLPMTRPSYLAYGIWLSWSANVYGALLSLFWRFVGEPAWLPNSDLTSLRIYLLCIAGVCHIIKPSGLTEDVPARETIRIGIIIGAAVGVGLLIVYLPDICAAWRGHIGTVSDFPIGNRA